MANPPTIAMQQLPAAAGLTGAELVPMVQNGSAVNGTVANIIALAGTSATGYQGPVRQINSGASDNATLSDSVIVWNSSANSAKVQNIPAGATGLNAGTSVLIIKDRIGTSAIYPIAITGVGCTVEDGASFSMTNPNKPSVTLKWDGVSNWMLV